MKASFCYIEAYHSRQHDQVKVYPEVIHELGTIILVENKPDIKHKKHASKR